jgi:hypothetical protein
LALRPKQSTIKSFLISLTLLFATSALVQSTDTRPFWEDKEDSPMDQGYHWNQNARSYFRIGKALGDDRVNLLSP